MSEPVEPTPGNGPAGAEQGGAGRTGGDAEALPRIAGAAPSTESEPAPSAAATAQETQSGIPAGPDVPGTPPPDQPTAAFAAQPPPGQYVFVPAGMTLRPQRSFGPAVGRFVRNRATQLVAAVVIGAVIGGGTVAIVDNVTHRDQPSQTVFPYHFGDRPGLRFNGQGTGT